MSSFRIIYNIITSIGLLGEDADILRDRPYQLLLLVSVIAVQGTSLISPILDTLTDPFGVSATEIGLMVTAISAPAVVLIPISGLLMDRYGRKPILVTGLLLFGGAGTAIAFTTDFRIVIGLRLLQGAGYAGTIPVVITSIGDFYSGKKEATGQGLRFTVAGMSQTVLPIFAGALVIIGWRFPFFIYSLAIPIAIALAAWFEEPTENSSDDGVMDQYTLSLARLSLQPRVLVMLVALALAMSPIYGFYTYNSLIVIRVIDGTPRQASLLIGLFSIVYAASATQAGKITARFDSRALPLILACFSYGTGLVLFAYAPTVSIAGLASMILGAGIGVTFPLYRSIVTGFAPEMLRGGLVSVGESLSWLSASVTPLIMGAVIEVLEPNVGNDIALQWTMTGLGVSTGILGAGCVLTARLLRP